MRLQLCTWSAVEAYLQRSTGIVVPIGSTEQHGPNGLIGTDAICPETIALGAAEQTDMLVAPTLSIGMAQHHLGFPGSIALRPSTLMAVICDVVNSLAREGFDRFYFLNGHGGNVATISAAFSEIYAELSMGRLPWVRPGLRLKQTNWWMFPGPRSLSESLFGNVEGSHATPSEVSLTFHAYPETASTPAMSPKVAPQGTIRDADDYRRQFPDGRIGSDPSLASVEAGTRLFEATVKDFIQDYQSFLAGD
jgi:creatinine amidohydrolase